MTYHLTVHTIIVPVSKKTNKTNDNVLAEVICLWDKYYVEFPTESEEMIGCAHIVMM